MLGDTIRIFYANRGNVKSYICDFKVFQDAIRWVEAVIQEVAKGIKEDYCIMHHGKLAGMAGFWRFNQNQAEVVLWLDPGYQGRGIAHAALENLELIMKKRTINEVFYLCDAANSSSARLAQACGYLECPSDNPNVRLFRKTIA